MILVLFGMRELRCEWKLECVDGSVNEEMEGQNPERKDRLCSDGGRRHAAPAQLPFLALRIPVHPRQENKSPPKIPHQNRVRNSHLEVECIREVHSSCIDIWLTPLS